MLIQKIIINVPDDVNELSYYTTHEKDVFVKYNSDELNRLKRKIVIYRTFDLDCRENNFFNLYVSHINYDWKTFHYSFQESFDYYLCKMEYEITFNKLQQDFKVYIK